MYKQVIVLRKDLNMRKGKMVAQGCHASLQAIFETGHNRNLLDLPTHVPPITESEYICIPYKPLMEWLEDKYTKIVVSVNSEEELLTIYEKAKDAGLLRSLIRDAGLTEFKKPTYTAVAVGPGLAEEIDKITGDLPLL